MRLRDSLADPSLPDGLGSDRAPQLAAALIGVITLLLVAAFAWLSLAEVEEVVRAVGQVEPQGRVKLINHPRGGSVAAIHVVEGQRVEPGALLLTFDDAVYAREDAELEGRWQVRAAEAARLEAEAKGGRLEFPPGLAEARPDLALAQARLMAAREASLASRHEALTGAVSTRRGELETARAELARTRTGTGLLDQQLQAVRELAARGLYPNLKLVAVEQEAANARGERAKAEAAVNAAQAALAESESRLAGLEQEWHAQVLAELSAADADRDRLAEQLAAQRVLLEGLTVRAPVAGVVEGITVAGPGQAVAAHEPLMKLVPLGQGLVVEARVRNEDIGRVRVGLPATLKVAAFEPARFGTLEGRVEKLATDAVAEPSTGQMYYAITVSTVPPPEGRSRPFEVAPGMMVNVEVKVGERTILSYLTDRLAQLGEAFREG